MRTGRDIYQICSKWHCKIFKANYLVPICVILVVPLVSSTLFDSSQIHAYAASGSIVLDNVQSNSSTIALPPFQVSLSNFVVGSGTNKFLIVAVQSSSATVSSITYGGSSLSLVSSKSNVVDTEFWKLTNPPSGTANIIVTMSGTSTVVLGAYSFFGVDQTTPTPMIVTNSSATGNPSTQITNKDGFSWVLDSVVKQGTSLSSPTQTSRWNIQVSTVISGASSSATLVQPNTSTTFGWTQGTLGLQWAQIAIEVKAALISQTLITETVTSTESITKTASKILGGEIVTETDSIGTVHNASLTLSESVTSTDPAVRHATMKTLTETVSVTDPVISSSHGSSQTLSEIVTATDPAVVFVHDSRTTLSESVTAIDPVITSSHGATRVLPEDESVADIVITSQGSVTTLTESVTATDPAVASSHGSTTTISESVTAADPAITSSHGSTKTLSEIVTATDPAVVSIHGSTATLTESVTVTDLVKSSHGSTAILSESVTAADPAITSSHGSTASLSDTVISMDSAVTSSHGSSRTLSEIVTATDPSVANLHSLVIDLAREIVTSNETISETSTKLKLLSESVQSKDQLTTVGGTITQSNSTHSGDGSHGAPPSFTLGFRPDEHPISINGTTFKLDNFQNTIPTQLLHTRKSFLLQVMLYGDYGPSSVQHVALYTNLRDQKRELQDSDTFIIWDKNYHLEISDPNKFFGPVTVNPVAHGNKLEVDFDIIFANEMPTSDIIIRTWGTDLFSADTHINNAWSSTDSMAHTINKSPVNKIAISQNSSIDILEAIKQWGGYSAPPISDSELLQDLGINGTRIPSWFIKTTKWVASGEIDTGEFLNALRYLNDMKIIR